MGRLSPPESVTGFSIKFIGNWTVLQIMSGDLGLTQNNCSLNSFLYDFLIYALLTAVRGAQDNV